MEQNQSGPGGFDRNSLQNPQAWQRSRSDRWVAGVCGGIGRALNIDPVLVRVVMAVLILSGPGIIFYIAAWALMPNEGSDRSAAQGLLGDRIRPDHPWLWPVVIGVCIFAAIAMMSSFNFGKLVPGPLIVLAIIWVVAKQRKNAKKRGDWTGQAPNWTGQQPNWTGQDQNQSDRPQDTTTASPAGQPTASSYMPPQTGPSAPPAGPSCAATQRPQDRTVEPVQAVWTEDDPLGLYVDEPQTPPPAAAKPAEPPAKGVRGVKSVVVLLTGIAIGIAALAGAPTATILIVGLATLGAGMLLGGFVGRTLALLPLGILLAIGALIASVFPHGARDFADKNFTATAGDTVTATNQTYNFDAGQVTLDLTQATFKPGARVDVQGGAGEVIIKVPQDVDVQGQLSAKMGEVIAFNNKSQNGHNAQVTLNDLGADGKPGPSAVTVDVNLKLGSITLERG